MQTAKTHTIICTQVNYVYRFYKINCQAKSFEYYSTCTWYHSNVKDGWQVRFVNVRINHIQYSGEKKNNCKNVQLLIYCIVSIFCYFCDFNHLVDLLIFNVDET